MRCCVGSIHVIEIGANGATGANGANGTNRSSSFKMDASHGILLSVDVRN